MSENFSVEIISPDKSILKSETTEVTIPSYEGEMGILKDHIPLITFLRPGLIKIKTNENEKSFFIEDGTVEFSNNNLLILTSTAKNLDNLDKNYIESIIKESQEKNSQEKLTDKEKYLLSYKIDTLKEIAK
jgi:F-type H+-transporting ATPase subunit epsilon